MKLRRGSILLECVLALALFAAAGLAILAITDQSVSSIEQSRDMAKAMDLARSGIARLEAGLATPETLEGAVPAWDGADEGAFEDSLPPPTEWFYVIGVEPSSFEGLSKITLSAERRPGGASEAVVAATLVQLVRLRESGPDTAGGGT